MPHRLFSPPSSSKAGETQDGRLKAAATGALHESPFADAQGKQVASHESRLAAYAAFEKAANEELDRDVGGAIARTLEQALPNVRENVTHSGVGARYIVPLHDRLSAAVRQEIETTLRGDRPLGEQVAQVLAGRNFNDTARAQVVRLIGERARQLLPTAAKRVINEWTQTALAAHRARTVRADAASARLDVAPASSPAVMSGAREGQNRRPDAGAPRPSQTIDYRKLSDAQILEL